jgi:hypothetical protein
MVEMYFGRLQSLNVRYAGLYGLGQITTYLNRELLTLKDEGKTYWYWFFARMAWRLF